MLNFLLAEGTPWYKDSMIYIFGGLIIVFGIMMVLQTRRRKSAQTEYTGMLSTLRPGTRVKTVGGVIGRIREIREEAPGLKTVLLQTGNDANPSLVLYDIQAIYGIVDEEKLFKAQETNVQNHTPANEPVNNAQSFDEPKKTKPKSNKAK